MAGGRGLKALLAAAAVLVLLTVLAAAAGYEWLEREYHSPGPAAVSSRIDIEPGLSLRNVLARLEAAGSVHDARAVQWYLRLHGRAPRVQAGPTKFPRTRARPRFSRSSRVAR